MASIGTLVSDEIGATPIAVNFDIDVGNRTDESGRITGLRGITGRLAAHEDPDFARNNIGRQFTLFMGDGGLKSRIRIQNERGEFIGDGLVPCP